MRKLFEILVAVALATACGSATSGSSGTTLQVKATRAPESPVPSLTSLSGRVFFLDSRSTSNGACSGADFGYPDVAEGATLEVRNRDGEVLGSTDLGRGVYGWDHQCQYTFSIMVPANESSYVVHVGGAAVVESFSLDEVIRSKWFIQVSLSPSVSEPSPPPTPRPSPKPKPKPTPKQVGDCTIKPWQDAYLVTEYRVTGAGTSEAFAITYENANGDVSQDTNARLPWHLCMYDASTDFIYVSAQNGRGSGDITCWILEGGDVSTKNTAHGGYAICTASE